MDERAYFERLSVTAADPEDLFEHFERREALGWTYHALSDGRHGLERGTVIVEDADAVVRGYPSVPRLLVLDPGVERAFDDATDVVVEEKLDGFNVRVVDVGEVLAFTRSGYVCPYTTERVRTLLEPGDFFEDHPEAVLCAELIGPETPYTTHDYDDVDSHAVRIYGVRNRETGQPWSVDDRRERCARYDLPSVREFGRYDPASAVEPIREAVTELDAAGREGVVLKTPGGEPRAKYTTESQHHAELADAFSLPFDYGREFLFSRVLREGFQAAEFDEDEERLRERARDLGEAILLPMVETIEAVDDGENVGESHAVRGDPASVDALLDHLGDQGLAVDLQSDRSEDGQRVVEFRKIAAPTTDRVEYYLEGGTRDE